MGVLLQLLRRTRVLALPRVGIPVQRAGERLLCQPARTHARVPACRAAQAARHLANVRLLNRVLTLLVWRGVPISHAPGKTGPGGLQAAILGPSGVDQLPALRTGVLVRTTRARPRHHYTRVRHVPEALTRLTVGACRRDSYSRLTHDLCEGETKSLPEGGGMGGKATAPPAAQECVERSHRRSRRRRAISPVTA